MKSIKLICLLLVLTFITIGCENKSTKLPEPTEPYEPTKLLHQAVADGNIDQVKSDLPEESQESPYLKAVREFADNVLKYGRDTYGPKHTPLFVDGLNIHTHEPVKWIAPSGEKWILSNFASQQTLLRTLDGLSAITGDPKYRDAAKGAIKYAFENLRSPNGLFYWGHVAAYDASTDMVRGKGHCLKLDYPHYELLWKVNPNETKRFMESYWSAHVKDWSNLDFNRSAPITANLETPWNHEYRGGPVFFKSKRGALGFFVTGSSLVHAGTTLYRLSGQEQPLVWSNRLAKRFVDTRHPNTGLSTYLYNRLPPRPPLGDDLKEHFQDPHTMVFPLEPFEEIRGIYYPKGAAMEAHQWLSLLRVGESLGKQGKQFTQWALEELTAWGKAAYRKEDNSFVPILTDGTRIEGYVSKKSNSYGPKGAVAKPRFADLSFFWAYTVAYRTTGDAFMWEMTHDIALGNSFGDIGRRPEDPPELETDTTCSDVYGLLGFLELYEKTSNLSFLQMARRIGDNIVDNQLHKGFFVLSKKHIYTRFDCFEPLALLHLVAAIKSESVSVPQLWPSCPLFASPYRHKQEGVDRQVIYALTESPELPLSLQEAAATGDIELVRSLLDKGVGIDSWDDSLQRTALQHAAMKGHREVVELLIAKGARIDAKEDWPGGTALHYAAEHGHKEVAELLIAKGADIHAERGYPAGDTPLHSAARSGHKGIVDLLITKGSDANIQNEKGQTPLDIAVRQNRKDIADLLLENSSIHMAASLGALAPVENSLEKGVDVNARDDKGRTPIHLAAQGGHREVIELLISKGADTNTRNAEGQTPLHVAIRNRNLEAAKEAIDLLLSKGADLNAKDGSGSTALEIAAVGFTRGIPQGMFEFLVSKGAEISNIHLAAYQGDADRVKDFLKQGVDANLKKTEYELTPIDYAVRGGKIEAVKLLISEGAGINAGAKDIPALMHAILSGHTEIAEFLLANGADPDAESRQMGMRPLHIAIFGGKSKMIELLIEKGANVNAKDGRGRTALDFAKRFDNKEMIELLKKHGAKE